MFGGSIQVYVLQCEGTCTDLKVVMKGSMMWYPGPLGAVSNAPPLSQTQTRTFTHLVDITHNKRKYDLLLIVHLSACNLGRFEFSYFQLSWTVESELTDFLCLHATKVSYPVFNKIVVFILQSK